MTVLLDTLDRLLGVPAVLGAVDRQLPGCDGDSLPLLREQARWWERVRGTCGSKCSNIVAELRLAGSIDAKMLDLAINDAIARHPALRVQFGVHDDKPLQHVQRTAVLALRCIAAHDDDEAAGEDPVERIRKEAAALDFDLAHAPLVDAVLAQLGTGDFLFLLTCHRLIVDRASIGRLVDEIFEHYERRAKGAEPEEPYANGALAALVAWEQRAAAAPQPNNTESHAVLHLPTFPRAVAGRGSPAKATLSIPVDILEALQRVALELETTVPLVLLAAWIALLDRYTSEADIVVWLPVASRHTDRAHKVVGCLERRVPIVVAVEQDEMSWLIHKVREIVESTAPEAASPPGAEPLHGDAQRYQAGFTAGGAPSIVGRAIADCVVTAGEIISPLADCDVELIVEEGEGYLQAAILYDERLLDAASAARIAAHLETLVASVGADPHTRSRQVALVTSREEQQLLEEWTAIAESTPPRPLHQLFEDQVQQAPDAIAVDSEGGQISYSDLNARSNRLAHALLKIGLRPEQLVGTLLSSGPDQLTAMLSVLKAGGAFVCLDPAFPRAHVLNILDETEPSLLIADTAALSRIDGLAEWLARARISVVNVDADLPHEAVEPTGYYGQAFVAACAEHDPGQPVAPDARAYIVYTVDSTGQPMGIVQTHRALGQFVTWQREEFGIGRQERWAQWGSIAHQASYCAVFGTVCFGATVCMSGEDERPDNGALAGWLRHNRATALQIPVNLCRQLVGVWRMERAEDGRHPLPGLRVLVVMGDVMPVDLAASLFEEFPDPPTLYHLYGPSEAISATYSRIDRDALQQPSIPLGRAIRGRQILILDRHQRLCPIGVRGEIYVRSPHLALGYFKRPAETTARFLQNPLHNAYEDRVFRAGQLGRWLPDGTIEFCGSIPVPGEPPAEEAGLSLRPPT